MSQHQDGHGGLDNVTFIEQMHVFLTDPVNHVAFPSDFDVQAGDGHHQLSPGKSGQGPCQFPLAAARFRALCGQPPAGPAGP